MNKYQEALEEASLCCLCTDTAEEANEYLIVLKELVDKATPKKVQYIDRQRRIYRKKYGKTARYDGVCPTCKEHIYPGYDYCCSCGQAIDWSNEE